jgi:serine/threonine protein kinase
MTDEGGERAGARWQRVEEIYHEALPLAAGERHAFVARACAGDATLRNEVNSLLSADETAADFLQEPVAGLGLAVLARQELTETDNTAQPTPPASADLSGTKVAGRYEVLERLGSGGFGEVYKALDKKVMSRPVVIKVLKNDALREEEAKRHWLLTKFQQEIEALAKIDDPGVVGVLDADTLPDRRPYLVMGFVEGCNLRHHIRQARQAQTPEQGLDVRDVAEIVRQVGRALTAAHEVEVFHRDLKPENIMLRRNASGDLQVKVIDFGIAKVRNSLVAPSTATARFVGTWPYMSPEQLQLKKVTAACDIYALGVIAYELVTGRLPFAAKDPIHLVNLQEDGVKVKPRDLNPDLPAVAQEAILKALSYYPSDRHRRARDFGDELARALATEEELAHPVNPAHVEPEVSTLKNGGAGPGIVQPRPAPAFTSWLRLHKGRIFAASVLLAAGLSGFAAWRALRTPEPRAQQRQEAGTTPIVWPERTLTYWLSVKRPRDKEPFESVGNVVYDAGSEFKFNVQAAQDGALYLFGEGHDKDETGELNTIFPTPISGKGDARIAAHQLGPITENPARFRNGSGVIYLWIIWAPQPVPLLDEIAKKSYDTLGAIRDPSQQAALRAFIEEHREPRPEVSEDVLRDRVTMKGRNEILVDMRKLEYRP